MSLSDPWSDPYKIRHVHLYILQVFSRWNILLRCNEWELAVCRCPNTGKGTVVDKVLVEGKNGAKIFTYTRTRSTRWHPYREAAARYQLNWAFRDGPFELQNSNFKIQENSKISNLKKCSCASGWSLDFEVSLNFGCWILKFSFPYFIAPNTFCRISEVRAAPLVRPFSSSPNTGAETSRGHPPFGGNFGGAKFSEFFSRQTPPNSIKRPKPEPRRTAPRVCRSKIL